MLAGEERAFQQFFDGYFPRLFRFATVRLGRDAGEAEELVQLTLCKAISKLGTYRGEARLFTWLCTFCRHEISAHYERRNRTPLPVEVDESAGEVRAALATAAGRFGEEPTVLLRRAETGQRVRAILDQLPAHYAEVLEWKYLEDLPLKEITERLGIGEKAAESLLTRARQAFRVRFEAADRDAVLPAPADRGPR